MAHLYINFDLKFSFSDLDDKDERENRFPNLVEGKLDQIDEERNEETMQKSTKWGVN